MKLYRLNYTGDNEAVDAAIHLAGAEKKGGGRYCAACSRGVSGGTQVFFHSRVQLNYFKLTLPPEVNYTIFRRLFWVVGPWVFA